MGLQTQFAFALRLGYHGHGKIDTRCILDDDRSIFVKIPYADVLNMHYCHAFSIMVTGALSLARLGSTASNLTD